MLSFDPGYGPLVETRVRIATWNVWGRYGPWEERLPAILATLRNVDADIVAVQEAWDDDDRSLTHEIAGALGYRAAMFVANLERDGARSGNALLARWPITRNEFRLLPRVVGDARDEENEERLVLFAEVDGPRGPIQVFCAHLSWRDDHSAVRQAQVADICALVRSKRPRSFPAVLCGDLNSEPHSDEIRMLTGLAAVPVPGVVFRDAWVAAGNEGPGYTASNTNPFVAGLLDRNKRIDYVMVGTPKLGGAGNVLDARVFADKPVEKMWASDHFGVVTELRY